jgi:hypothetical protein
LVEKTESLLNRHGLEMLGSCFAFSLVYVYTFMSLYRPEAVTALFYPEGRYGPPLLREQFVCSVVFSALSAIAGFIIMAVMPNGCLLFSQERLVVEDEAKAAVTRVATVAPPIVGALLVLYLSTMAFAGPFLLRLSRLILRQFIPLRPTFHSLRACIEIGALYQFVWCGAALCLAWEGINLIISILFANSFKVSQQSPARPMAVLLDGLEQSGHPLIQEQAVFELHQMLMKDPAEREKLFSEFVADVPASKLVSEWLVRRAKKINEALAKDLALLRGVEAALETDHRDEEPCPAPTSRRCSSGSASIFIVKPESFLSGFVKRLFHHSSAVAVAPLASSNTPGLPEILKLRTSHVVRPVEEAKAGPAGVQASWLSRNVWAMTDYTAGKYLAGFIVQYYRTRSVLQRDNITVWVIQSLARLASVSLTEDRHGQVQFALDQMLAVLLETFFLLLDLHNCPRLDSPISQARLVELALSDDGDHAFHRLLHEASAAIEEIRTGFEGALEDQPDLLGKETRARLDAYQKLLASISDE